MDYCSKHMDKEALSFCHNCGKFFCRECLSEGKEYYYCYKDECQRQLHLENEVDIINLPYENREEKDFVKFYTEMNQADAALFKSILDDSNIDYYCSSGTFFDAPVEFYICADQIPEVEEILKNFHINSFYYSTKNDLTE
jgi:hypothetical protein